MDIPFTRDEKVCVSPIAATGDGTALIVKFTLSQRFVLAEIIKSSSIDIDSLLAFINANHVDPNWMNMQLPLGKLFCFFFLFPP